MDGYDKTTNLKLNIIKPDNIVDIEPITENFETLDDYISKLQLKSDKVDIDLSNYCEKGKILPQDVKGNTDKRLYKYVVLHDSSGSDPFWWVEYVNENGENVTNKYHYNEIKYFNDMKTGISNNHDAINSIENELNGKVDRIKNYNDEMDKLFK